MIAIVIGAILGGSCLLGCCISVCAKRHKHRAEDERPIGMSMVACQKGCHGLLIIS